MFSAVLLLQASFVLCKVVIEYSPKSGSVCNIVEELSQEQWVSRRESFGKGLNTQSSNTQRATTTVLAGVEGEGTAERRRSVLPRFRALRGR